VSARPIAALALAALLAAGCAQDRVVLLPGEDGAKTGAVAVLTDDGKTAAVIDKPYSDARVDADSASVSTISATAVSRELGGLLDTLPPPPKSFVLYFREGTTTMIRKSQELLPKIFAEVAARPGADVQVVGHTSTLGSHAYNDALSQKRAREIANLLIGQGLDPKLVRAVGRGERDLLVPTPDGVRNAKNRRVEVMVR